VFHSLRVRIVVILAVAAICGWSLYDNHRETGSPVRLGLDLQGGIHLVLEVDDPEGTFPPDARAEAIEQARRVILNRVDELGVAEPIVQVVGRDRLIVELAGISDEERARETIGRIAMLEWRLVLPAATLEAALPRIDRASEGLSGDTHPVSSLLFRSPEEGEFLVPTEDAERVRALLDRPEVRAVLPREAALHWGWEPFASGAHTYRRLFVLEREPVLTGDMLEDARPGRDQTTNRPLVHFDLSRAGGRTFGNVTASHIGERLAIVLDGEVVSAPFIRNRIGGAGVIELTGSTLEEARDLALVLRAGALPAPLRIMEQRAVGPSLGQDSIDRGRLAGIVGLALVVAIMIGYYRVAGLLAVGALAIYVLLLLGGLAAVDATLTLPGIAGIILSIGMAVDANVLIFERIREEIAARGPGAGSSAVDRGFGQALSAIVDANVTTLITALVLFQLGTGPVRGFAVTLSIGIVASFFTALYVTRTLFLLHLRGRAGQAPSM
jgi:protein-export membrane protein SecD